MSVKNNLCETCIHNFLCKYKLYIEKFSDDVKNPMGINIEILQCSSYDKE